MPALRKKTMPGDGSCFFRAVVEGIRYRAVGSFYATAGEQTAAAKDLRKRVVEYIAAHPALVLETPELLLGEMKSAAQYIRRLRRYPNAYANQLEVTVTAVVTGHPIAIYRTMRGRTREQGAVIYGFDGNAPLENDPIAVLHRPGVGNTDNSAHYDLLYVPVKKPGRTAAAVKPAAVKPPVKKNKPAAAVKPVKKNKPAGECARPCTRVYVCNPLSRRCIIRSGALAKKLGLVRT